MIHTEFVEPWQLRQAMAGYAAQGYPPRYGPNPDGGGFVIIIMVPDGAAVPDWRMPSSPPRRRPRWDFDVRVAVKWLCVLVIVGGLGYLGYTMASGGALSTWEQVVDSMPKWEDTPVAKMFEPAPPYGEPVVEETGWHWPWESSVVSKPQPKQDAFRWPWQDAQDAAGQVVESVKMAGLMIVGLFAVLAGLWVVGIVRGAIGK